MDNVESNEKRAEGGLPFRMTPQHVLILALVLVIVLLVSMDIGGNDNGAPEVAMPQAAASTAPASTAPAPTAAVSGDIERKGEGRLFYTTIRIPANAETLYLSGSGASAKPDGTWGNMEEQAIDTFNKFKATLEAEGWSMADIVQVRCFAVADEFGLLDFDGFNRGYSQFFGTEENPNKPVRSFVQVAALVNPNWLVEVEIRAARVPD